MCAECASLLAGHAWKPTWCMAPGAGFCCRMAPLTVQVWHLPDHVACSLANGALQVSGAETRAVRAELELGVVATRALVAQQVRRCGQEDSKAGGQGWVGPVGG